MFERFLNHSPKSEEAPAKAAPAPAAMPSQAAPEEPAAEPMNEPLPEVRTETMSDSLNPDARPPMAHSPIPKEDLAEEIQENDLDNQAVSPPDPPSFLKTSALVDDQDDLDSSSYYSQSLDSNLDEPVKKKEVIQPSLHPGTSELRIVKGDTLHAIDFADIWYTPEGTAYVRDTNTYFALTPIEAGDLGDFHRALEQGYTGNSSYAVNFNNDIYRVERVMTLNGLQYNCRKMPKVTPEIETLGFAAPLVKHITSLGTAAGLLLFAGPTGQGKTTTASALMKRFLDKNGGFLYTIEDPPEMPLSGVYHAQNGGLGLCKQVPVEHDHWGAGLRSALRSRPRYILVGEIRTPETASQCLVAATSGHLVISTIHANGVEDALNSMIKYAASAGLAEDLAADLLARGILGVVHQRLEGTKKLQLIYQTAFANPNSQAADQMRMCIRDRNINLSTFMEQQKIKMERGLPMFRE